MIKKSLMVLSIIWLCSFLVRADIPPPKGFANVAVNYVVETKEDLSEYRFFFDFAGALEEVEIKSKGKTSISPIGGGARYRSGRLLAIPAKSLENFGDKLTYAQKQELSESLREKNIEGVIELGSHTFTETIQTKNGTRPSSANYVIIRQDGTLKMFTKKKTSTKKKVALTDSDEEENITQVSTNTTVAGIFLSLSFLLGGIFVFRKVNQNE